MWIAISILILLAMNCALQFWRAILEAKQVEATKELAKQEKQTLEWIKENISELHFQVDANDLWESMQDEVIEHFAKRN